MSTYSEQHLGLVAISTQDLEVVRIAMSYYPLPKPAASANNLFMLITSTVDVVDTQEGNLSLFTASTLITIVLKYLSLVPIPSIGMAGIGQLVDLILVRFPVYLHLLPASATIGMSYLNRSGATSIAQTHFPRVMAALFAILQSVLLMFYVGFVVLLFGWHSILRFNFTIAMFRCQDARNNG
jgi:hypothetical protein